MAIITTGPPEAPTAPPPARARARQETLPKVLFWLTVIALVVIIIVPIVFLLLATVSQNGNGQVGGGFSTDRYSEAYTNGSFYQALLNTVVMSVAVTAISLLVGGALAWVVGRTDVPGARVLEGLILASLILSPLISALGWSLAVEPGTGIIGAPLDRLFDIQINLLNKYGVFWVLSLHLIPFAYVYTVASLRSMDPSLEQAARIAGLSVWQTTRKVTLPLVKPAILSATLMLFITCTSEFGVPLMLGVPGNYFVLTTRLYALVSDFPTDWEMAATLSTMLLIMTVVAVFIQIKALGVGLKQFAVISGRGYRPAPMPLGRFRWIAFAAAALYAFLAGVLPMLTLLYESLIPEFTSGLQNLTLVHYTQEIFENERTLQAIVNTVLYAALAATLSAALATVSAWLISRSAVRGRILLEYLCMIPSAVPHIVLAIGYLWAFVQTPIYGTMWVLILGYAAGFVPFALRAIQPAMLQVDKSLEEAGQMSGLGWFRSMRSIMIPLIRASLASSWLLLFLLTIRELPVSLMLYTEGTQVYSVVLFNAWHAGFYHQAAAIATTQTILMVVVIALVRLVGGRGRTVGGLM